MHLSTKQLTIILVITALLTIFFTGTLTGKIPNVLLRIHPFPEIEFELGAPGSAPVKAPPHPKPGKHTHAGKERSSI